MTIPNILSFVRIALVPLFVYSFFSMDSGTLNWWSIIILVISGLTDLLDGFIARKFNQVSDLGKILDPIADKLTQVAVCACLAARYHQILYLLIFYLVKELLMLIGGILHFKKGNVVPSAKWYGKIATFELYTAMVLFLVIPDMQEVYVNILTIITLAMAFFALIMYIIEFLKLLNRKGKKNDLQQV